MFQRFFSLFQAEPFLNAWDSFWSLTPVWLPILLLGVFFEVWMRYVRTKYIIEQGSVLLELKIPKLLDKPVAAMEIVLQALSQPLVGSYIEVFLKGRIRPWFSLELVSLGGQVKFFIWTHKKFKNLIESQIYSQFPTVEIYEVPDYSLQVPFNEDVYSYFGAQLKLSKADVYPIKSYIDYGLNDNPKEEFKVDPITPVIEYLGSLKQDEQTWIQILVRAHREENLKDARFFKKTDWKAQAKKEIDKIISESPIKLEEGKTGTLQNLTDIQKDTINAIQRNLSKTAFDSVIRCVYLAKKESFNGANIGGMLGSMKQYSSGNLNGFRPSFTTSFDYPWQDFRGKRLKDAKQTILDAYKRRSYFHPPHRGFGGSSFVLSVEELATMFHFPGGVSTTPTFSRIVSKKGEPPANLPI